MNTNYYSLVKKDKFQVFILTCPANFPVNFAIHPWFVCNEKGKLTRFEIYHFKNKNNLFLHVNALSPFKGINKFLFVKKYSWKSKVVYKIEGALAKDLILFIKKSTVDYPYLKKYSILGPNSNTYVQWVLDNFKFITFKLPRSAIGKNYFKKI